MSLYTDASLIVTPNAYKAGKLYSLKPTDGTGNLDVVRATTATRVNNARLIGTVGVNVPRLDYSNGSCPSILVEPQATNLVTYSEEFDNAVWAKTNLVITPNLDNSPSGTLSADKATDNVTVSNSTYILNSPSFNAVSGSSYTASIFAKNIDRRYIYIRFNSGAFSENKFVFFDLQLGVVSATQGTGIISKIELINGYYRCSATATASTTLSSTIFIGLSDNGTSNVYINPIPKSIYIWGAQLEAGSYATSYIPTVASTVTRNADVISKTGLISNNFLSNSQGTWFIDLQNIVYINGTTSNYIGQDSSATNKLTFGGISNKFLNIWLYDNSISYFLYEIPSGSRKKIAFSFNLSRLKIFVNGVLVVTRNASLNCNLWNEYRNNNSSFGSSQNLMLFFPTQLTDSELIALTTL